MDILPFLTELLDPEKLKNNQFVTAAIVAAPATALTYAVRNVPLRIYHGIRKLVSITVRFNNDMPDYDSISRFITTGIVINKLSRNFNYSAEAKWDEDTYTEKTQHHGLTAGYGTHFGRYKRRLCIIRRSIDEANQSEKFKESMSVTFFGGQKTIKKFAAEIAEKAGSSFDEFTSVPIYINSGTWWQRASKRPLRSIDTVFTSNGVGRSLVEAIQRFDASRAENHRLGLPHHLGILLYGTPGCGKSSLIHALASELGRSIYYLNLGAVEKDKELTDLMASGRDWSKSLLVLEDFDAAGASVSRGTGTTLVEDAATGGIAVVPDGPPADGEKKRITLSTLLNLLDGLISPDGLVTIATTNHPERLDEALRRPGRFDHAIELGKLGYGEFLDMANLFGVDPTDYPVQPGDEMTGAEMRALILNPQRKAA